ncbi:MAG TPA: methyltransferase domain-containing protein [Rhizomicrobium sp.]|nr:methyltransferase domain-containing protein [Rhizomicrobium sp.]
MIRSALKWLSQSKVGVRRKLRVIWDDAPAVGDFTAAHGFYRTDLDKEEVSRRHIFAHAAKLGRRARFLDVGGKDGSLTYLLSNRGPLWMDEALRAENAERFANGFDYFGLDIHPTDPQVVAGDICGSDFRKDHENLKQSFDVIYSNNVFEHLSRPWIAAENLLWLLRPGGICITIAPFSQRYHEDPGDFFRYTHKGLETLFEQAGSIKILESGFDIRARRYNWQGSGHAHDIVPVDRYGAWRETWFAVLALEKIPY